MIADYLIIGVLVLAVICMVIPVVKTRIIYSGLNEDEKNKLKEAKKNIKGLKTITIVTRVLEIVALALFVLTTVFFFKIKAENPNSSLVGKFGRNVIQAVELPESGLSNDYIVYDDSYSNFRELSSMIRILEFFVFVSMLIIYSECLNKIKKAEIDQETKNNLLKCYKGNRVIIVLVTVLFYAAFFTYNFLLSVS